KLGKTGNFAPILWCRPETAPFNKFPLLPVISGNDMKKSLFRSAYFEESANVFIDVFNMAYVAFTRAKSVLIVHCPKPKEEKKSNQTSLKPIEILLKLALENLTSNTLFNNCWNDDKTKFQFGEIPFFTEEKKSEKSIQVKNYQFNDFSERVRLRNSGENFLVTGENRSTVKNKGKIMHEILSSVKTK